MMKKKATTGMRRFYLERMIDETGVSGIGKVAEGTEYSNGWVAMIWLSSMQSMVWYPNIKEVEVIHGHNQGQKLTKIIWID
jgi:hypothetical protein